MGGNISSLAKAGAVYIYSKTSGSWVREATLSASDKTSGDNFGSSVDIDSTGTRVIVGAKIANPEGKTNAGEAYVFVRSDTTWTQEQVITSVPTVISAQFGLSVAIDDGGNRIVIGAPYEDKTTSPTAADRGYAYVFLRSGTSWALEQKLSEGGINGSGETYGYSVDIDSTGTRIVLSIPHYNNSIIGGAVVLKRTGTVWAAESTLLSGESTRTFGGQPDSVSINSDGSVIAIGDYGMNITSNSNNGAVFIFGRSGTTWSKINRLNTTLQTNGSFGFSTALTADGSNVIIGASGKTISSIQSGAVYSFI